MHRAPAPMSRAERVRDAVRQAKVEVRAGGRAAAVGPVAQSLVAEIERALKQGPPLPRRLRRAVRRVLAAKVPVGTVTRLAREIGCSRFTLWREWEGSVGRAIPPSLFIELVTAARYQDLRDEELPASEAAARVGLTLTALRKRCWALRGRILRSGS